MRWSAPPSKKHTEAAGRKRRPYEQTCCRSCCVWY
jgi:hypothetical protein